MNSEEEMEESATTQERFVYCGPNIPGGLLQQFTVFKGGTPGYLDEVKEACPEIGNLFVPPDQVMTVRRNIGVAGTAVNIAYAAVVDYCAKGGPK